MFIQGSQYKALREAAKNGDERAKIILKKQFGNEDFSGLLNEYFNPNQGVEEKPATEPKMSKLEQFLAENNISKDDPDYEESIKMFQEENPEENIDNCCENQNRGILDPLIEDELEAIQGYDKALLQVSMLEHLEGATKKGIMSDLEEIRADEYDHIEKLRRLKEQCEKKVENIEQ